MSKLRVDHHIALRGRALARGRWRRVKVAAASGNFGAMLLVSRFLRPAKAQPGKVVKLRALYAAAAAALLAAGARNVDVLAIALVAHGFEEPMEDE